MSDYPFGPCDIQVDDYLEPEFDNEEERAAAWDRLAELTDRYNSGVMLSPAAAIEFRVLRGIFEIESVEE